MYVISSMSNGKDILSIYRYTLDQNENNDIIEKPQFIYE